MLVASSAGVPVKVRVATRIAIREQERNIRVIDSHIDRGQWWLLDDKMDQRIVRYGQVVRGKFVRPFECNRAYPAANPFGFTGL